MKSDLTLIQESEILFNYNQGMEDPRDGLTLFGPLQEGSPGSIRTGVIGTQVGIRKFKDWVDRIQEPIVHEKHLYSRPFFPGFTAAFHCAWNSQGMQQIIVDSRDLQKHLYHQDAHYRVYGIVGIFVNAITDFHRDEHPSVDVWFVVIPDEIYKYCRPNSVVPEALISHKRKFTMSTVRSFLAGSSLFPSIDEEVEPYKFEVNFREQLKARLLKHQIPTQIIRESTIAPSEYLNRFREPIRKLDTQLSQIAWTLSTAAFFKAGGRPWKLASVRPSVCYIGLAFKADLTTGDERNACCAAQMFLDSGDGIVFKGAVGPWHRPKRGDFHLGEDQAYELISLALKTYKLEHNEMPKELFIHSKSRFDEKEWRGFKRAAGDGLRLVGVTIKPVSSPKLYRDGEFPILRGLAYIQDDRSAYLWTKGWVPRLRTSIAMEVPNPLQIEICKGEAAMKTVLQDVLALTKLNYNACIYGDGLPVTLRFADSVGEILTAAPLAEVSPLSFKYYI